MATQAEREIPHFQVSSESVPPAMAFEAFQQSVQDVLPCLVSTSAPTAST
jgi:hypothetical protein